MVLVIGGVESGKRTFVRSLGLREADLFDCALAAPDAAVSGAEAPDGKTPGAEGASVPAGAGSAPAHALSPDGVPASAETWDAARARLATCVGVVHLEEALRPGGMFADAVPDAVASALAGKRVVACCEVGSGVVPADADARAWRERVGRVCCALAARSDAVVRMVCGIPQVLKGSLDGLAGEGGAA
ncbi:MAG: bifunctional adenosylcobinamide kinase/adenosylcobinamide-phosphate guanylyltransferase [Eggerthellaceae bacterium]|jgi:hypothetical protein